MNSLNELSGKEYVKSNKLAIISKELTDLQNHLSKFLFNEKADLFGNNIQKTIIEYIFIFLNTC